MHANLKKEKEEKDKTGATFTLAFVLSKQYCKGSTTSTLEGKVYPSNTRIVETLL